jgi:antidote-toxin recognition MazE-like antitoxin
VPSHSNRKPAARGRKALSVRDKVRAHRARLRAQGLRPITIWVPDTRSPEFLRQARRQARLIARSSHAEDDQAFIDAISEWKPD